MQCLYYYYISATKKKKKQSSFFDHHYKRVSPQTETPIQALDLCHMHVLCSYAVNYYTYLYTFIICVYHNIGNRGL